MSSRNSLRWLKRLCSVVVLAWVVAMLWQTHKPLPPGVHVNAAPVLVSVADIHFLYDLTYETVQGERCNEQRIFDAVLQQIDAAQHFIVLDFFLINDVMGGAAQPLRPLSRELADHLLARKRTVPSLQVLLITDPINDVYNGAMSALLNELQEAGIEIVRTDLTVLRDSNAGYSAIWRGLAQWWGNSTQGGWLPNPFDANAPKITLRSWLNLLNFKANHRKLIVSDRADGEWQALVASANPHDASSAHSNVALQFTGELTQVMLEQEINVARFSGWKGELLLPGRRQGTPVVAGVEAYYLTEAAILAHALRALRNAQAGDQIQMAMFYLSQREVIEALKQAAGRGVQVRLILDPNKDAFGIQKDGVPNRPVANELVEQGRGNIEVRWYRTHGEQFHTKLLMVQHQQDLFVTLGSANFTRRNLDDYNLEANVALKMTTDAAPAQAMRAYFERLWQGDASSPEYTAPFGAYRDDSIARYWRYRLMEATGLSTF
ncbi:MAG: phospholipase D-like domain-containing protein [Steroidobacteraceae bacterium]